MTFFEKYPRNWGFSMTFLIGFISIGIISINGPRNEDFYKDNFRRKKEGHDGHSNQTFLKDQLRKKLSC